MHMTISWFGLKMDLIILLLVLVTLQGAYSETNIDCGANEDYQDKNGMYWSYDLSYIETGISAKVLQNTSVRSQQMNSLRFFPDQNKVCYVVYISTGFKYLIRAGFYYGNYDGQMRPPTFDLQIDGNKWAAIVTSLQQQPIFKEVIIMPLRNKTSICVARTRDGEIPFISSLEVIELPMILYRWMDPTYAMIKEYRWNFGANRTVGYPDDRYRRVWDPANPIGYNAVTANFSTLDRTVEDDPPLAVLNTAIEAQSPDDEILLEFKFPDNQQPYYVTLYFIEVTQLQPNQNRTFLVDVGAHRSTVNPRYQVCDEIDGHAYYTYGYSGSLLLLLTPISDLPPIISAMEVFTMIEYRVQHTSTQDLEGLQKVVLGAEDLLKWTGDPCLPVNSTWEWLECNQEDPPRITALSLPGYGISGFLGNFSQMEALEIIELQDNKILGTIPEFLGELPNLRVLNLANNRLEGTIPESLLNKKISLNVSGNPGLKYPRKMTGLIVGLSVGLAFAAVCLILFLHQSRKKRMAREAGVELNDLYTNPAK